jgi:hypothetical protein
MGFFAAISVESVDVTIDLNGFTMTMCEPFYKVQRFFSHIELADSPFVPVAGSPKPKTQGPSFFGDEAFYKEAHHCTIKNGKLGRSSHHGIHGNAAGPVVIEGVHFFDFEVGAIQLNGAQDVRIEDVEIGPSATSVPFLGAFSQARFLLPYLRNIVQSHTGRGFNVRLAGLNYTFERVYTRLLEEMYDVAQNGKRDSVFHNEKGLPDGSAIYGVLLHKKGAQVGSFGGDSTDAPRATVVMRNVDVHDLALNAVEIHALASVTPNADNKGVSMVAAKGPVGDIMNFPVTLRGAAYSDSRNPLLDAQLALHQYLRKVPHHKVRYQSTASISDTILNWAMEDTPLDLADHGMVCGGDVMHHTNKGAVGLRLAFANIVASNVSVHKISNQGTFDQRICSASTIDERHADDGFMAPDARGITFYNVGASDLTGVRVSGVESGQGNAVGLQDFGDSEYADAGSVDLTVDGVRSAHVGPLYSFMCEGATKRLREPLPINHGRFSHGGCVARFPQGATHRLMHLRSASRARTRRSARSMATVSLGTRSSRPASATLWGKAWRRCRSSPAACSSRCRCAPHSFGVLSV